MTSAPEHDPDWLAFRYLSGEMSDTEAAALEERLAEEQPLREALARMAELTQTVALTADPSPMSAPRSSGSRRATAVDVARPAKSAWVRPAAWSAVGAAACLALVLAYNAWQPDAGQDVVGDGGNGRVADPQPGDVPLDELANFWLANRANLELADPLEWADTDDADEAAAELLAAGESEYEESWIDEQGDPIAPNWLLLAVRESSSDEMNAEPIMPEAVPDRQEN